MRHGRAVAREDGSEACSTGVRRGELLRTGTAAVDCGHRRSGLGPATYHSGGQRRPNQQGMLLLRG